MIGLTRIIRLSVRLFMWLFTLFTVIVLVWFIANRFFDESPDPNRDKFFVSEADQIPDDQNTAVAILGLTAPTGTDFIQYGKSLKALYINNGWDKQFEDKLNGPKTLHLTVESDQIYCWLDPDGKSYGKECLSFDRAPTVLQQNKELLDRYKSLFGLTHYSAYTGFYFRQREIIEIIELLIAEMQLDLRHGQVEAAYDKWHDQFAFARRNLHGSVDWVSKAIDLVVFGYTYQFLEKLLYENPSIVKEHAAELLDILHPESIEMFNTDGVVRAEYSTLSKFLSHPEITNNTQIDRLSWLVLHFGQRNRMLNNYFGFAREYSATLRLPWNTADQKLDRLTSKYDHLRDDVDFILDPIGTLFLTNYIHGQLLARELLRSMYNDIGRLRLATLLVRIINENVSDEEIPHFLATVGPELRDPFSTAPIQWDQKNRRIYFIPDPKYKCSTTYMRVPNPSQAEKISSVVGAGAGTCKVTE